MQHPQVGLPLEGCGARGKAKEKDEGTRTSTDPSPVWTRRIPERRGRGQTGKVREVIAVLASGGRELKTRLTFRARE